jgi:hypothetical protein
MKKLLLVSAALLAASSAQALPLPGHNTFEMHCRTMDDSIVDPIKSPGIRPSAHPHTHYGFLVNQYTDAKALADGAQKTTVTRRIQNIPSVGPYPPGDMNLTLKDPGYTPLPTTCQVYGDWSWSAIPRPTNNGMVGTGNRRSTWSDPVKYPRAVSLMTQTWASPIGVPVYEPPYGMTAIVGNAHAMNEDEQDNEHVYWTCGDLVTKSRAPRDCTAENGLVTGVVVAPDCWDGKHAYPNFDVQMGIDRAHFYYSKDGSCGVGVRIAQLFQSFHFGDMSTGKRMVNPLNADGTIKLTFASGPYYTFHADYAALGNHTLAHLIAACLNEWDTYGGVPLTKPACRHGGTTPMPTCPPLDPNAPDLVNPPVCRNKG